MLGYQTNESSHALLVTEEKLRYLHQFVANEYARIRYEIGCVDGTKLEPRSFDEILAYENPSFKRISHIKVVASSDEDPPEELLVLHVGSGSDPYHENRTVAYEMRFSNDVAGRQLEAELGSRIAELRPWYWWLTSISLAWFLPIAAVGLVYCVALIASAIMLTRRLLGYDVSSDGPDSSVTSAEVTTALLIVVGVLVAIGFVADRIREYLFPHVFFVLGRQHAEHAKRKHVQNMLFGLIFVTVILGIIVNVLTEALFF